MNSKSRRLAALLSHFLLWHQNRQRHSILEIARTRILVSSAGFGVLFLFLALRLADIMIWRDFDQRPRPSQDCMLSRHHSGFPLFSRQDILDCRGEVIATTLSTSSIYANPKIILDHKEAALRLSQVLPDTDYNTILRKLETDRGFVWIARHISPALQHAIMLLGIPGVYVQKDEKRVYPHGSLFSHVLGYCGVDNDALAGMEKSCTQVIESSYKPLITSLDLRAQHVLFDELSYAVKHYEADGANAILMEIPTGKIRAMVSLPDFDPHAPSNSDGHSTFNRNTLGVYECGSVFKIANTAIALETNTATLFTRYDASCPIKVGRFKIEDFKGKYRVLDVREGFIYSSNILNAKMALDIGSTQQKNYLQKLGLMEPVPLELPEIGTPLIPKVWRDSTVMTVSYGYGISVTPTQVAVAMSALVNDGRVINPTLLENSPLEKRLRGQVISAATSAKIRDLMRLVMTEGTARAANVPGFEIIGKTGTAYKLKGKEYCRQERITSFIGAFPKRSPRYCLLLMLDNPKAVKGTYGYATAGWNAAPTAGRMIARLAPLIGVTPVVEEETTDVTPPQSSEKELAHFIEVGMGQ